MSEAIRYAVVCDHPELNRRYFVADIDDDRPVGGSIHWRIYRGGYGTLARPANRRGSRTTNIPFACGVDGCGLNVELRDTSVPDLLDRIAPQRHILATDAFPTVEPAPIVDAGDWYEQAFNGAPTEPSAAGTGVEQRYVLPLKTLCAIISGLRDRRIGG